MSVLEFTVDRMSGNQKKKRAVRVIVGQSRQREGLFFCIFCQNVNQGQNLPAAPCAVEALSQI